MPRGTWITVAVVLAIAIAVTALGLHVSRRDRTALEAAFSEEQLARLRIAAIEAEKDLADGWHDLELVIRLMDAATSEEEQTRELQAILRHETAYPIVVVYGGEGRRELTVVDPDLPAGWSPAPYLAVLDETARRAASSRAPATSHLLPEAGSPWLRVIAAPRERAKGGAVALLVDVAEAFRELRFAAPGRNGQVVVLAPGGGATPLSPPALTDPVALRERAGVAALVAALKAGELGSRSLSPQDAAALGV
jgi:hypothetical protein